jgi:hypothetical protein
MDKVISCTVPNPTRAEEVVGRLQAAGFTSTEISVLFTDNRNPPLTLEKHTKAPEGAAAGGGAGGVIGGILGLLAGIGTLAIPGVGPLIAAGPIMAALSGAAAGAAVGGLIGTLVGLGIPEIEAKRYESKLKEGHVLVSVHAGDETRRAKVRDIFKRSDAEDISETHELAA